MTNKKHSDPDILAYLSIMEEIKRRTDVVIALLNHKVVVLYLATHIETIALQIRMILELIALASLAANKALFEENSKKFKHHWHPEKILEDIEKINPGFFPIPVNFGQSNDRRVEAELYEIKDGYLTRKNLIEFYGSCGNILHAKNPYKQNHNHEKYHQLFCNWMDKIIVLLNFHKIQTIESRFYLVSMKGDKNKVSYHVYDKIPIPPRN